MDMWEKLAKVFLYIWQPTQARELDSMAGVIFVAGGGGGGGGGGGTGLETDSSEVLKVVRRANKLKYLQRPLCSFHLLFPT